MQTHLIGRDMITPDEWTDDEVNTIFEVAFDLKRKRALGEPHVAAGTDSGCGRIGWFKHNL